MITIANNISGRTIPAIMGDVDTNFSTHDENINNNIKNLSGITQNTITKEGFFADDDTLYITDLSGNTIASIDSEGLHVYGIGFEKLLNPLIFENDSSLKSVNGYNFLKLISGSIDYLVADGSEFIICDANGNVVFKIDSSGVFLDLQIFDGENISTGYNLTYDGTQFKNGKKNFLFGKKLVGIGDSLSANGYYEQDVCNLSGAEYNGIYSAGGTFSAPNGSNGGQDRVKQLIDSSSDVDIILYENVNDDWFAVGVDPSDLSDNPFFLKQYSIFANGFATKSNADAYWISNFNDVIATVSNKIKGTVIRLAYTTNSTIITVSGSALNDGTITINVGDISYNTAILSGDSAATIAQKISITNYIGYSNTVNSNILTLTQTDDNADTISITQNTTNATLTTSGSTTIGYSQKYFMGYTESEFNTYSYWQDSLSLISQYKGIIEALQYAYPNATICWVIPTKFSVAWNESTSGYNSDWMNSDGTFNYTAFYNVTGIVLQARYRDLVALQKSICNAYNIKYVDCTTESGISLFNIQTYYKENDVHPFRLTYTRWAEIIVNKLS